MPFYHTVHLYDTFHVSGKFQRTEHARAKQARYSLTNDTHRGRKHTQTRAVR